MLNKLAEITLRSQITKNNSTRQKQFLPWDKIQKIALVISKDETINKSAIDKFISQFNRYYGIV